MFRVLRRKSRAMDEKEALEVLAENEYGFLASCGEDGWPYCIPVSYVFKGGEIFFHCAHEGHKIDNIKFNSKVCFSVVGNTQPVYDRNFTTYYESVVVFGTSSEVTEDDAKKEALFLIADKYLPEHMDKAEGDIERSLGITAIYKIKAEHISGKEKKPKMAK